MCDYTSSNSTYSTEVNTHTRKGRAGGQSGVTGEGVTKEVAKEAVTVPRAAAETEEEVV